MDILENAERIGIFGAGISNKGIVTYLKRCAKAGRVTLRSDTPLDIGELLEYSADIALFGKAARVGFDEDVLFLSPSVRRDSLDIPPSVRVSSDSELFFDSFRGQVIAVSGTDGKSTTTELIRRILCAAGLDAVAIGNCGVALTDALSGDIGIAVAELSSFQLLQYVPHCERAVITNISENHLDMHRSYEEYRDAKLALARSAEKYVFDADCRELAFAVDGTVPFAVCSIGADMRELMRRYNAEYYVTYSADTIFLNGEPIIKGSELCRREEYNIRNTMLAIGATAGLVPTEAYSVTGSFEGLSHRAECVFEKDGIRYIDSSIDSTPARSAETLKAMTGRLAVVICGKGKRLSYAPLLEVLYKKANGAVLMGDAGRELYECAAKDENYRDFRFIFSDGMEEAVRRARELVGHGTVLLSPAATSYDKYKDYKARGVDFLNAARLISKEISDK